METQTEQKVKFCRGCGGTIEYDIAKGKLRCKNCGYEPEMEQTQRTVQEHDFRSVASADMQSAWDNTVRVLKCPSCGAEISAEAHVTGVSCRYCGTQLQVASGRSAGVPPEAVAPFKIQKHDALAKFTKWVKKRFFAPGALKTLFQTDKLLALFLPFWTFDAHAHGMYTGEGGKKHTRTVTKDGKNTTETSWTWTHVTGTVDKSFDDILIYAGAEKANVAERLHKFDLKNSLIPFSNDYLAGFTAETYTLDSTQGFERAEMKMKDEMTREAQRSIKQRFDDARSVRVNVSFSNVLCKHILLPVWSTGFTYKGKYYNVMINGVSGEIQGEYPKSAVKIIIFIAVCLAVIAGVAFAITQLSK